VAWRGHGSLANKPSRLRALPVKIQVVNKGRLTKARRSWNMSRIRAKDAMPEKAAREEQRQPGAHGFMREVRAWSGAVGGDAAGGLSGELSGVTEYLLTTSPADVRRWTAPRMSRPR
jgi:hypothetical protein